MKRLILGLAVVAAIGACSRGGGTPGAVVEDFARRLDSGNCTGLRDVFANNSRELVGEKIESVCQLGVEQRKSMPNADQQRLKTVHIMETKEEGDRATVRADIETNAGQRQGAQTFVLVRENGAWKIDLLATGQMNRGGAGGPNPMGGAPTTPPVATPAPTAPAPDYNSIAPEATTNTPAPADAEAE